MSLRLLAVFALAALSTLATAIGVVLFNLTPRESVPIDLRAENTYPFILIQVSLLTVGAAIAWRHPANPIGWLFSATGLAAALAYLASAYAIYGTLSARGLPSADVAGWIFSWGKVAIGMWMPPLVFLFPDGRLRSRHDGVGLVMGLSAMALIAAMLASYPGPLLAIELIENPYGWKAGATAIELVLAVACALVIPFVLYGISSLRARYRAAGSLERLQLKWFCGGAVLYLVTTAVVGPAYVAAWLGIPVDELIRFLANLIGGLAYTIFPIAIGIAILRYRLYEIDVVIRRTLVYGAVSLILAATYLAAVLVLQAALRSLTSGSELAVAGSTLMVIALFQPLRARIQTGVDRRFYRSHYDAARTLDDFSVRLRDEVDLDAVRSDLLDAVDRTVQPASASVWLREQPS